MAKVREVWRPGAGVASRVQVQVEARKRRRIGKRRRRNEQAGGLEWKWKSGRRDWHYDRDRAAIVHVVAAAAEAGCGVVSSRGRAWTATCLWREAMQVVGWAFLYSGWVYTRWYAQDPSNCKNWIRVREEACVRTTD
jgi:hypothetical protein